MALTGEPGAAPVAAAVMPLVREFGDAFRAVTARLGSPVTVDAADVLSGRAGVLGLTRGGRVSPGGRTRLLPAADGWCAVSLSRPDDLDLVPAIVGASEPGDPWEAITARAARTPAGEFAAHVQRFGVPAAALPATVPRVDSPWRGTAIADTAPVPRMSDVLVADLSALWAGPLCARLLGQAGATVIKVESVGRPDGARGSPVFFDWLHGGQLGFAVDFMSVQGRAALRAVIDAADVVIEASRPRALAQLGLAPETRHHRPGKVWVSITGYGRRHPDLVAFGDDAAVAGGLVGWSGSGPVFCADAIADPLTGLVAALAAVTALDRGGGLLVDVSMRDVAALRTTAGCDGVHRVRQGWRVDCSALGRSEVVAPPRLLTPTAPAPAIGADTAQVLVRTRARLAHR